MLNLRYDLFFKTCPETSQDFRYASIEGIELLQHVVLPLLEFIQQLSGFVRSGVMGRGGRHEASLRGLAELAPIRLIGSTS